MDKQQLATLFSEAALHLNGFSRQDILNGVSGTLGNVPVFTDDLATYLDCHSSEPCTDEEFEKRFIEFVATQISKEDHAAILSSNEQPPTLRFEQKKTLDRSKSGE